MGIWGNIRNLKALSVVFYINGPQTPLRAQEKGDTRLWEVAVLFHLRDAFRSGDVWLAHSRRYGDLKQVLGGTAEFGKNRTLS